MARRYCAIKLQSGPNTILLVCVYLLTDYHTDASAADFSECLSELSGFIDSQLFDHLLIGGDFNVDVSSGSSLSLQLRDFMSEFDLSCVDCLSPSITHMHL